MNNNSVCCRIYVVVHSALLFQVKHRNASVYKRIRDVISSTERKFYVFSNEHHR